MLPAFYGYSYAGNYLIFPLLFLTSGVKL